MSKYFEKICLWSLLLELEFLTDIIVKMNCNYHASILVSKIIIFREFTKHVDVVFPRLLSTLYVFNLEKSDEIFGEGI